METKEKDKLNWKRLLPLALPLALAALFYLLRGIRGLMDSWVNCVAAPLEQTLGRLWSLLPFSAAEALVTAFLLFCLLCPIAGAVLAVRSRSFRPLLRRLLTLACALLWAWTGCCWLWSAGYYASTFTEKSGLHTAPSSVDTLAQVTQYFAQQAAALSAQVARDEGGRFAEDLSQCFQRGVSVYENLEREFPCLSAPAVRCKPMFYSRLLSILGFTGGYFPFTGEANVNVDAPACLVPATIAHEMSHQRMVFSEQEANFVGIAAAVTCGDPVFQYSGYLMGLIQLCNALYAVDPDRWYQIAGETFTPELSADWNDNNAYWRALQSPVEEAASQTFDSFLKGNGQELGIQSYGACVDLLVVWLAPRLGAL